MSAPVCVCVCVSVCVSVCMCAHACMYAYCMITCYAHVVNLAQVIPNGVLVHMYPQRANTPLQGLNIRVLTVGAVSDSHCLIGDFHWRHFTNCMWIYMARKNHSGEADQLTLASLGSEHA